jgi:hypothetical protein
VGIIASVVQPAQLSVLTLGLSSIPSGTISMIRSPPGSHRIQQLHMLIWWWHNCTARHSNITSLGWNPEFNAKPWLLQHNGNTEAH